MAKLFHNFINYFQNKLFASFLYNNKENIMENYRDVPGYEGLYSVSDHGNVYNHRTNRVLKANNSGYPIVNLCKDSKRKSHHIHKLVAMAFLDHMPGGYTTIVDHIDNDKTNNHISNLQLTTVRHNTSKDQVSKYDLPTGVTRNKKRFMSRIQHNGQRIYLGTYITIEEASNAYQSYLKSIT
tara:strand:+ start:83 stop:628 length:546 start_codon:yes stop_codon:yes gene_type:complete